MTKQLVRGVSIRALAAAASAQPANHSVVGWGHNDYGQYNVPAPNSGFVAVGRGGGDRSLGLKPDGSIVAWGRNIDGQCNVPPPTQAS